MSIAKNIAGDTIVEVLIAMVVLALILTGAYVTSNSSLSNIVDAQERIQGLGYAQNQLENLRGQASTIFALNPITDTRNNNQFLVAPGANPVYFCFNTANVFQANSTCSFGTSGHPYTVQVEGLGPTDNSNPYTTYGFKVTVTWPSVTTNTPTNNLTLYYRVGV